MVEPLRDFFFQLRRKSKFEESMLYFILDMLSIRFLQNSQVYISSRLLRISVKACREKLGKNLEI